MHGSKPYFDTLDHSYKELTIPPTQQGEFALSPGALHIWPREAFMVIALPNPDRSFTATLFLQNHGTPSFAAIQNDADAAAFFTHEFASAAALMPEHVRQLREHPQGVLGTLRCQHWHYQDAAVLIGDAAHAMVPFHGQGMNCAFEDCLALAEHLQSQNTDRAQAFAAFAAERQPQAHAIAEMALENYIEMRDLVADDDYRLRKALEQKLALRHPGWFVPRYELVSFTRHSYALSRARGVIQSDILQELCKHKTALSQIDLALADTLIQQRLAPLPALG
jgi:kynurenine 3-monooxygenase